MDKFTYEEGELNISDCQCDWCVHYNSGKRSDACPKELLDDILNNKIVCPNLEDPNSIDLDKL